MKNLITAAHINQARDQKQKQITVAEPALITPEAKDLAKALDIEILRIGAGQHLPTDSCKAKTVDKEVLQQVVREAVAAWIRNRKPK